jgi:hypothetical protein
MKTRLWTSVLVGSGLLLLSQTASAGFLASVVGTWNVQANQSVGTMNITFQAATGACRKISGDILGLPMVGFYCPATGRIQFLRNNLSKTTFQTYSANLSFASASKNYMSGSFSSFDTSLGEYSFYASK